MSSILDQGSEADMAMTRLLTSADLERMGDAAERYELIAGVLRATEPMGGRHGEIQFELHGPLYISLRERRIGRVYTEGTHFLVPRDPDVVSMPDIAFVRAERLPPDGARDGMMPLAPDLVIEVFTPSNRVTEMAEKIGLYQQAGVPLIWLVRPRNRSVEVYVLGPEPRVLDAFDSLDGGDVLPGFRLPVAEIFR